MNDAAKSILDGVSPVGSSLPAGSEIVCGSPLCSTVFPQGKLKIAPRRYCSDDCRLSALNIRKAAELLKPLGKEKAWEILSNEQS